MRRHLPNIILFLVVLANIYFIGSYIWKNGLGLFLNTTGIVLLVLGVFIFIFFLSIDPAYKWVKSIDLTKNYIMIFISMAVCMIGVVFIVSGQKVNELHLESLNKKKRCRNLITGNAVEVLKKDWYSLKDQQTKNPLNVYLFQKKSDRNNYKIIATVDNYGKATTVRNLTVSSDSIPGPIMIEGENSVCSGVYEKDISIDYDIHQRLKEQIDFALSLTLSEAELLVDDCVGKETTVHFDLHSQNMEIESLQDLPPTQVGNKDQSKLLEHNETNLLRGQT